MTACCGSIEAVVWDRHGRSLTEVERDLLCAALTLDGPEQCAANRLAWAAIAEESRRPGRIRRAQAEVEAAIVAKDPARVTAAIRARRALQEGANG